MLPNNIYTEIKIFSQQVATYYANALVVPCRELATYKAHKKERTDKPTRLQLLLENHIEF
jgi:hypothetical protein